MSATNEGLQLRYQKLKAEMAEIEAKLNKENSHVKEGKPGRSARPIREIVLDALMDIGHLAYSQQLSMYISARYGRTIPATRFGTLSKDEESSVRVGRSTRAVWLCHALTFDRGEPIRRLWARSDWPLYERIITPTTSRVLYLKMTARLADLALQSASMVADLDKLKYLVADHARDLGLDFKRGYFPLEEWRESAQLQLKEIEDEDLQARRNAAVKLEDILKGSDRFFGRYPELVALPGKQLEEKRG